jgi:hypothetical protein
VTEQKTKLATAVVLATLAAFLLVGASYVLFPEQTLQGPPIPKPMPKPEPLTEQIGWALLWIGSAAGVASAFVAAMLLVSRINRRKPQKK